MLIFGGIENDCVKVYQRPSPVMDDDKFLRPAADFQNHVQSPPQAALPVAPPMTTLAAFLIRYN